MFIPANQDQIDSQVPGYNNFIQANNNNNLQDLPIRQYELNCNTLQPQKHSTMTLNMNSNGDVFSMGTMPRNCSKFSLRSTASSGGLPRNLLGNFPGNLPAATLNDPDLLTVTVPVTVMGTVPVMHQSYSGQGIPVFSTFVTSTNDQVTEPLLANNQNLFKV